MTDSSGKARWRLEHTTPHIAQLIIDNTSRRNAVTARMWSGLPGLLERVAASEARVLVLSGAGEHFSAGADIAEFETLYSTPEGAARASADIQRALDALAALPVPSVARICGACVGGGMALALACDVRIADSTARFAITPAKLGLVYPFADVVRLCEAVGAARARDLLLTARMVGASEADAIGLVHRVAPPGELDAAVDDYAEVITQLSPHSLRTMKSMLSRYSAGQRESDAATDAIFLSGFTSDDFAEGFRAFLERRKPGF